MSIALLRSNVWQGALWLGVCWLGAVMLLPVVSLIFSWFVGASSFWAHLLDTELWQLLYQTISLLVSVTLGSLVLGTSLALLTTLCDFPGRKYIVILSALPLAIPTYVMGFVWLDWFDYSSPLQTFLREYVGIAYSFAGFWGISLAMSFALFPYVFLMARIALKGVDMRLWEASFSLGHGYVGSFRRVILPMLSPALLTACAFVAMEVISDFGTVSVFSYNTLTTAIFKAWFGFFDLPAALQVAGVLLCMALGLYLVSRYRHARKSHWYMHSPRTNDFLSIAPYVFSGVRGYGAFMACFVCVAITTLLPVWSLLRMAMDVSAYDTWAMVVPDIFRSVLLAVCVCAVIVVMSCCGLSLLRVPKLAQESLLFRCLQRVFRFPTLGYAFPGAVLAVAMFVPVYHLENWFSVPLFTSTIALLLVALAIHFFVVGFQPLAESYALVPYSLDESSQSLGVSGRKLFWRVHWSFLRYPVIFASLMVFMDVIKEMPLTLMLRPLGWDTMSVKVYEWASEGEWEKAAVPSLIMVALSMMCLAGIGYFKSQARSSTQISAL